MTHYLRIFALLAVVASAAACQKEYSFDIDNINNRILALGHGGMGNLHKYPINTFESIKNCLSVGADGTEIDVQMTSDGFLFAFHDEDMERTTTMSGRINSHTYKQVELATYDKLPNGEFQLVTLNEIFGHIKQPGRYHFSFDVKLYPATTDTLAYYNRFADELVKVVDTYGLHANTYIESRSEEFIRIMHDKAPALKLFYYADSYAEAVAKAAELPVAGITIAARNINRDEVALLHQRELLVATFGASTSSGNFDLIRLNPDIIQTDNVRHLVRVLK